MNNTESNVEKVVKRVVDFDKQKYIVKKLKACRVADKPRLYDCYTTLTAGHELDETQHNFLVDLYNEDRQRASQYNKKWYAKRKAKQAEAKRQAALQQAIEETANENMVLTKTE
jgi:hypothetical protein